LINTSSSSSSSSSSTFGPKFSPFFGVGFPYEKKYIKITCGKRRLKIGSEGPFPSFAQIGGEYLLFPMVSYCSLVFLVRNPRGSLTYNYIPYTIYTIYPHFGSQRKISIQTPLFKNLLNSDCEKALPQVVKVGYLVIWNVGNFLLTTQAPQRKHQIYFSRLKKT